ncbi:MAG: LCP family protein [Actinomycetota bacterium]
MIKRGCVLVAMLVFVAVLIPLTDPGRRGAAAPPVIAGRVHDEFQPNRGKIFVLVIGSDARAGNPDAARADALHVVGINTRTMKGGILNFPRDSWVSIPGHGQGRINESLYQGGPKLVARTVESLTGIRLDYWVMTGFEGFGNIVRALNGVPYEIHQDIFDPGGSGARIRAGTKRLNQFTALQFVRTRHNFPRGDIDRTTNQAKFLLAMLRKLRSNVRRNPPSLLRWIAAGRKHTRLNLSPQETFRLAVLATQVKSKDVGNVTIPVSYGAVGAASVVFISPGAQSIYQRFRRKASL